jgi:hypothetical protein
MSAEGFEREVMRSLGRIEQKVDGLSERSHDDREYMYKISNRVGDIEHARSRRKGAVSVISAVVSAVVALLVAILKGQ